LYSMGISLKIKVGQLGCPHRINLQGSGKERRRGQQLSGGLQTRARLGRVPVRWRKLRMRGLLFFLKTKAWGSAIVNWIYLELDSHIGGPACRTWKLGFTQEPTHTYI